MGCPRERQKAPRKAQLLGQVAGLRAKLIERDAERAALLKLARFAAYFLEDYPDGDNLILNDGNAWEEAQKAGLLVLTAEKHPSEDCECCADDSDCYVIAPDVAEVLAELKEEK